MTKSLLEQIDARAAKLELSRSQYFAQLARNDLAEGGALMIQEKSDPPLSSFPGMSPAKAKVVSVVKNMKYPPLPKSK